MNKILRRCLVVMSMVLTFGFVFSGDVSALDSYVDQSTVAKAAFEGVYRCARHEAYSKNISGLTDSSTGAFGINTTGNLKEKMFTGVNESTNYVTLPYRQSSIFSETSCKAIMSGTLSASKTSDGSFSDGLKKGMMSNVMKKDVSTQKAYLKSIGYEESGDSLVFKGDDLQFTAGVAKNNDTNIKMNITDYSSLKLTEQETYNLYRYYLTNNLVYGLQPVCEGDSGYDSLSGNVKTVKLFADKKCKVNLDDAKSPGSGVYGVLFGGQYDRHFTGPTAKLDVNQVIAAFEKMDFSQINPAEFGAIDDTSDEDEDGGCQGSGAGASLGWILCPVLEVLSNAAGAMYDIVVPYLEIDTSLFVNQDEGTRFAWETFRNMANVVFIILLLIVIFSQLTGVGIDNYGIKKILPKMIVAAILINMSYLICILGVELSNIVGNGVKALFDGLPSGAVASTVDGSAGSVPINGIGNVVSVGLIVAIVGGATAAFFNPAILLSLIVTGLGILISLVFLFILLAAREAAIIVLIVISPLAFACIMLPNTKKLFDKWFKASKGLILLYPICGLMVGGGNYVSRLLISSQPNAGIASALIAMLVGIVPIFFIPTVLKGAFAAFGNIGSKISGFGDKLRGGATRGIRGSESYKSLQERGRERNTMKRAGIYKDENGNYQLRKGALSNIVGGGKRARARKVSQFLKDQKTRDEVSALMDKEKGGVAFEAAVIAQQKGVEKEELSNYETLVDSRTNNGSNEAELKRMFDEYSRAGNGVGAAAVARVMGRRKDYAVGLMNMIQENGLDDRVRDKVAKEVATGSSSGTFRNASPFGFAYASAISDGTYGGASYNDYVDSHANEIVDNFVTSETELNNMKGGEIDKLYSLLEGGKFNDTQRAHLHRLANNWMENKDKPGANYDLSKIDRISKIANYDSGEIDVPHGGPREGRSSDSDGPSPYGHDLG